MGGTGLNSFRYDAAPSPPNSSLDKAKAPEKAPLQMGGHRWTEQSNLGSKEKPTKSLEDLVRIRDAASDCWKGLMSDLEKMNDLNPKHAKQAEEIFDSARAGNDWITEAMNLDTAANDKFSSQVMEKVSKGEISKDLLDLVQKSGTKSLKTAVFDKLSENYSDAAMTAEHKKLVMDFAQKMYLPSDVLAKKPLSEKAIPTESSPAKPTTPSPQTPPTINRAPTLNRSAPPNITVTNTTSEAKEKGRIRPEGSLSNSLQTKVSKQPKDTRSGLLGTVTGLFLGLTKSKGKTEGENLGGTKNLNKTGELAKTKKTNSKETSVSRDKISTPEELAKAISESKGKDLNLTRDELKLLLPLLQKVETKQRNEGKTIIYPVGEGISHDEVCNRFFKSPSVQAEYKKKPMLPLGTDIKKFEEVKLKPVSAGSIDQKPKVEVNNLIDALIGLTPSDDDLTKQMTIPQSRQNFLENYSLVVSTDKLLSKLLSKKTQLQQNINDKIDLNVPQNLIAEGKNLEMLDALINEILTKTAESKFSTHISPKILNQLKEAKFSQAEAIEQKQIESLTPSVSPIISPNDYGNDMYKMIGNITTKNRPEAVKKFASEFKALNAVLYKAIDRRELNFTTLAETDLRGSPNLSKLEDHFSSSTQTLVSTILHGDEKTIPMKERAKFIEFLMEVESELIDKQDLAGATIIRGALSEPSVSRLINSLSNDYKESKTPESKVKLNKKTEQKFNSNSELIMAGKQYNAYLRNHPEIKDTHIPPIHLIKGSFITMNEANSQGALVGMKAAQELLDAALPKNVPSVSPPTNPLISNISNLGFKLSNTKEKEQIADSNLDKLKTLLPPQ